MNKIFGWFLVVGLFFPFGLVAQDLGGYFIRQFDVEVTFTDDGKANFKETIDVHFFEPRHGIYRYIPLCDVINGEKYCRDVVKVWAKNFNQSISYKDDQVIVRIGNKKKKVFGEQTYVITYQVANPFNFYERHTEFYWDLLGTNWDCVINKFTCTINFPESKIEPDISDFLFFAGKKGTTTNENIAFRNERNRQYKAESLTALQPHEAISLAIKLDRSAFPPPTQLQKALSDYGYFGLGGLFLIFGGILHRLARNKKRSISTEYFPPNNLPPLAIGSLYDMSTDVSDITAMIPHLGNRGYLKMKFAATSGSDQTEVTLERVKPNDAQLSKVEEMMMDAIFKDGDLVEIKSAKGKLNEVVLRLRQEMSALMKQEGFKVTNQPYVWWWVLLIVVCVIMLVYVIFVTAKIRFIFAFIAVLLILIFSLGFSWYRRSEAANELHYRLLGFKEFIKKAEKPVLEKLLAENPNYYHHIMPYAFAFGYLTEWTEKFDGLIFTPAPYQEGSHRNYREYQTVFNQEMDTINNVFDYTPESSGGSSGGSVFGGGGGGSAGGGSGGGGGGSW